MAWTDIVNRSFTPDQFAEYVNTLTWTAWRPSFIVLHNTAVPTLAQRPDGLTESSIQGLVQYYRDQQKWSAGPHLFIDDKQIWAFTPLTSRGVHSPSWNNVAVGIEMLGDYDKEDFNSGRGLAVQQNAVAAIAAISAALGFDPATMRLHKEDPATTHKNCPGKTVDKVSVIQQVTDSINGGEHTIPAAEALAGS